MSDANHDKSVDAPLNPALKITTETAYDTDHTTPAPIDTASAKEGEGEGWPIIWLIVAVICVGVLVYLLV